MNDYSAAVDKIRYAFTHVGYDERTAVFESYNAVQGLCASLPSMLERINEVVTLNDTQIDVIQDIGMQAQEGNIAEFNAGLYAKLNRMKREHAAPLLHSGSNLIVTHADNSYAKYTITCQSILHGTARPFFLELAQAIPRKSFVRFLLTPKEIHSTHDLLVYLSDKPIRSDKDSAKNLPENSLWNVIFDGQQIEKRDLSTERKLIFKSIGRVDMPDDHMHAWIQSGDALAGSGSKKRDPRLVGAESSMRV